MLFCFCFDCDYQDRNAEKIEEQRKEREEKQKKEEEKRKEYNSPGFIGLCKLARELTKFRGKNPIGVGDLCNREVYEYSDKNVTSCPKCGSRVSIFNESLSLNYEYDRMNGYNYLNRPGGVCNEVCFYDLTSKDIYLVNLNLTCEKKDENGYYLAINGKKYPLPNKKDWKTLLNDYQLSSYLFRDCMLNYDSFPCFTGGGVGYFFERNVSVYSCDGCGYQYHLVSMSSFIHRDKSKDGIVEEIKEEIKEENKNEIKEENKNEIKEENKNEIKEENKNN